MLHGVSRDASARSVDSDFIRDIDRTTEEMLSRVADWKGKKAFLIKPLVSI